MSSHAYKYLVNIHETSCSSLVFEDATGNLMSGAHEAESRKAGEASLTLVPGNPIQVNLVIYLVSE